MDERLISAGSVDKTVLRLRRLKSVEVDGMLEHLRFEGGTFFWLGIAGVKETGIIQGPPDLREPCSVDLVIEDPAGVDIHHANGPPIGAAFLDGVGEIATVMRDRPLGKRGCSVLRPVVGVDNNAIRSVVSDIQDGLRLQTGASDEEIAVRGRKALGGAA